MHTITAYCAAKDYDLHEATVAFSLLGANQRHGEVLHHTAATGGEVLVFSFGAVIFWQVPLDEQKAYHNVLDQLTTRRYVRAEEDLHTYRLGSDLRQAGDSLVLPNDEHWTKLAVGYSLAQSIKLRQLENVVLRTTQATQPIIQEMAAKGTISPSDKAIVKKLGALFLARRDAELHTETLFVPRLFWDHAEVEPIYELVCHHQDLRHRAAVLKGKLETEQTIFDLLSTVKSNRHSEKLEKIIIGLIAIEVLLAIFYH